MIYTHIYIYNLYSFIHDRLKAQAISASSRAHTTPAHAANGRGHLRRWQLGGDPFLEDKDTYQNKDAETIHGL